jgi:hypothetical protein
LGDGLIFIFIYLFFSFWRETDHWSNDSIIIINIIFILEGDWSTKQVFGRGFARGSPRSVFLAFSQSYVEHDLRKNKNIVVPFFANRLIFMS